MTIKTNKQGNIPCLMTTADYKHLGRRSQHNGKDWALCKEILSPDFVEVYSESEKK